MVAQQGWVNKTLQLCPCCHTTPHHTPPGIMGVSQACWVAVAQAGAALCQELCVKQVNARQLEGGQQGSGLLGYGQVNAQPFLMLHES
jgi:hypothetical protein